MLEQQNIINGFCVDDNNILRSSSFTWTLNKCERRIAIILLVPKHAGFKYFVLLFNVVLQSKIIKLSSKPTQFDIYLPN